MATGSKENRLKAAMKDSLGTGLKLVEAPKTIRVTADGETRDVPMDAVRFAGEMMKADRASIEVRRLPVDQIELDPGQPRKTYDEEAIEERAESLKSVGQLQPARVYWHPPAQKYRLVFGHLRWLGAQKAELPTLDCVVVDAPVDEVELRIAQLSENTSRTDMPPLETAVAFSEVLLKAGRDAKWLAERLGISKGTVSKALALLKLPQQVQDYIADGVLAPSSAYLLARLPKAGDQVELACRIVNEQLNRDQVESEVKALTSTDASGQMNLWKDYVLPEMKTFVLHYDGAAGPSCYFEAVSLDAAKSFATSAIPAVKGCVFRVSPCPKPAEGKIATIRVLTPAHSITREWIDSAREQIDQDLQLDQEHAARYCRARAWLDRAHTGDTKLYWDQWCELDARIDDTDGGTVRVVFHGDVRTNKFTTDVEIDLHTYGPLGTAGHEFVRVIVKREMWEQTRREGLRALVEREINMRHRDWLKQFTNEWKHRSHGSMQWRSGLMHFVPAVHAKDEPEPKVVKPVPSFPGNWNTEPARRVNSYTSFGQWSRVELDASAEEYPVEAVFDLNPPGGDFDYSATVTVPPKSGWAEVAEQLAKAAHSATYLACLEQIQHPEGRAVSPGDRVKLLDGKVWTLLEYKAGDDLGQVHMIDDAGMRNSWFDGFELMTLVVDELAEQASNHVETLKGKGVKA
jgi:ParB family transcriptional regulator, chromosome partitioning protein